MSKRTIGILSVITLFILLIFAKKKGYIGGEKALSVQTENVFSGSITETVPANGKIQPETEIKISPDVSGEIIELLVKEGDWVEKNQLLLKINPEIYAANLDGMLAALNSTKANLAQQEAQLRDVKTKFIRNKQLFEKGAISSSEFETSENNYELAKLAVVASEHNVTSSQAAVKEAENNLKRTSIYAPISGTISQLHIEKGERVVGTAQMSGTELLRIADFKHMEVVVDVSENDILRVGIGDRARVNVDAYMKEVFEGEVTEIANSADLLGSSVDQVTNFEVKIRILKKSYEKLLDTYKFPFRPGMTASVDIITEVKNEINLLSIQSVTTRKDSSTTKNNLVNGMDSANADKDPFECVFVVKNGKAQIRAVKTGIQDDEYIEITSGLKDGEEVIKGPYGAVSRTLRNQMKIKVEN